VLVVGSLVVGSLVVEDEPVVVVIRPVELVSPVALRPGFTGGHAHSPRSATTTSARWFAIRPIIVVGPQDTR